MAIAFSCECGRKMQAKEEYAGKRMKCPECRQLVTIPQASPKRRTLAAARPAAKPVVRKAPVKSAPTRAPVKTPLARPVARRPAPEPDPVLEELTEEMSVPARADDYEPDFVAAEPEDESNEAATAVAAKPAPKRYLPFLVQQSTPWQGEDQRRLDPASRRPDSRDKSQWLSYTILFLVLIGLGVAAWWFWDDIRGHLGFPKQPAPSVQPRPKDDPVSRPKKKRDKDAVDARKPLDVAKGQLKEIALAMNAHVEKHNYLPMAALNKNLSWRVALLPHLGHEELYKQFKLDEAWNSPNNILLLSKMPAVFERAGGAANYETHYQVFTGAGTLFDGEAHDLKFKDLSSQTILIVEARKSVPWTAPYDLAFEPGTRPELGAQFQDAFLAVFADFTVHALPNTLKQSDLEAYVTPNGGETVDLPDRFAIVPAPKKAP